MGKETDPIPPETNRISGQVVDSAMMVHTALGPGLLESVYETCLAFELENRGIKVQRQVPVGVKYKGVELEVGFRMDRLVGKTVVVELKAVEEILPIHEAQLMTYLKLTGHRVGLLLNFNVVSMKKGLHRIVI